MRTLAAVSALLSGVPASGVILDHSASFDSYVKTFNRPYTVGTSEYQKRQGLFHQQLERVNAQNSNPDRLWTAGINQFSDHSEDEVAQYMGYQPTGHGPAGPSLIAGHGQRVEQLPEEVHWMNTSAALNVKNQGACGSCWAFATAALLKSNYELHMGKVAEFSEQDLVSCVKNPRECGGQGGCKGATTELAMDYALKNGLGTTPYEGAATTCKTSGSSKIPGLVGYQTLPSNKAAPLMHAVSKGPVGLSVAASPWAMYMGGVFNSCGKDAIINHAVLLVGYGIDKAKNVNYWTVQNSWGPDWGEEGFIRVLRQATAEADDAWCGTDHKPEDGIECKPYPKQVTVCGMCGILYDSVSVQFDRTAAASKPAITADVHFMQMPITEDSIMA